MQGLLASKGFAIVCNGITQGMMLVDMTRHRSKVPPKNGKDIVYIDYLECAPWNRPEINQASPYFRGVGSTLIAAAIMQSFEEDFRGRIGLHSIQQAETWYRTKCGMTDLGSDPHNDGLRYFEMTTEQAHAFIQKGNH
ncbi:hypothetical protein [Pseudomonas ogarae]|uniref:hypothetical protein n=1 Tax=Pseudomonas ogarae (strain DSM 112162 / CECT 30235 / F113) TaxID=1114970 RepID=UPI001C0F1158|nr:hypothetical protein [Pseudomonas ogarae]